MAPVEAVVAQARRKILDRRANHSRRQGIARRGPFAGIDMFRATLTHHLARVERGAAGARNTMGPGCLTDGVAALQARTSPNVYRDTAVHVLVVDCEFQRIAPDVLLVTAIKLDR